MLVGGLRTVDERNPPLVTERSSSLLAAGASPPSSTTASAAARRTELALALDVGGVRCRSCGGGRPVTDEALRRARAVLGGGLNVALSLPDGSLTHEVESIATTALELHVERRLRSLQVLHDW